jgi:hypothetical protein
MMGGKKSTGERLSQTVDRAEENKLTPAITPAGMLDDYALIRDQTCQ